MKEITGNIFDIPADAICVTTNGVLKGNKELVMGAGIALEFKKRFPGLPSDLGILVEKYGNHVFLTYQHTAKGVVHPQAIISLPTKHDWKDRSDLTLIIQSCRELVQVVTEKKLQTVLLTRPGCGLGGLNWEFAVKPLIKDILDDRFYIVTPK